MMAHCEPETKNTKQHESKYHIPSKFPVIDGVRYFPGTTREFLQHIKNLPLQGDEVIVASYPKAGTTWVSEIVWQVFLDGTIDMTPINQRVPFLEASHYFNHSTPDKFISEHFLSKPYPRVFKTHLQYSLAPIGGEGGPGTTPKYINVIRNPKDCAVSFYHHTKSWYYNEFDGSWGQYFEVFIDGEVKFGSWFDHVLGWWAHRDDPNILTLKYEEMKKDLPSAVKQIAKFVGKDLSEETIQLIVKQTSFEAMSTGDGRFYNGDENFMSIIKPNTPKFVRKGEVGDWKNYFTEEQNRRFDELYDKKMAGSGLELEFS